LSRTKKTLQDELANEQSNYSNTRRLLQDKERDIQNLQTYLGVSNLSNISTSHPMPTGKNLKDLIDFYNNPPKSSQLLPPVEVVPTSPSYNNNDNKPKPEIKLVEKLKTVEVDNPQHIQEINRLNKLVRELEEKLSQQQEPILVTNSDKKKNITERIIVYPLLVILLVSLLISFIRNKKKKN
jgi:hypothetical protein